MSTEKRPLVGLQAMLAPSPVSTLPASPFKVVQAFSSHPSRGIATKRGGGSKFYSLVMILFALSLRFAIIWFTDSHSHNEDGSKATGMHYTDIDYYVLRDGAERMRAGLCPYDRPTFRYSPLLALSTILDSRYQIDMGKYMHSLCGVLTGALLLWLLSRRRTIGSNNNNNNAQNDGHLLKVTLAWLLNPIVLNVDTRGSHDSVVLLCLTIAVCLVSVHCRRMAALVLGLAMHLKLFPVIYLPTFLVYYNLLPWAPTRTRPRLFSSSHHGDLADDAQSQAMTMASGSKFSYLRPSNRRSSSWTRYLAHNRLCQLRWRHVEFLCLAIGSACVLFYGLTYRLYGGGAVEQSLWYHVLHRRDHRHNFSPMWLPFYLHRPDAAVVLNTLAQVLVQLGVAIKFGRVDLPGALFLQTLAFVAFNKVITVQVSSHSTHHGLVLFLVSRVAPPVLGQSVGSVVAQHRPALPLGLGPGQLAVLGLSAGVCGAPQLSRRLAQQPGLSRRQCRDRQFPDPEAQVPFSPTSSSFGRFPFWELN